MKKLIIILLAFPLVSFGSASSTFQYPSPISLTTDNLRTNLISYWKFENPIDAFGSQNLTESGSPTYTSAKVHLGGNQGSNNTTIKWDLATNGGIDGGAISAAFWVNFNTIASGNQNLFEQDSTGVQVSYALFYNGTSHVITFERNRNNVSAVDITETFTLATGTWYHYVITYDGSLMSLYRDNSLKSTSTASGNGSSGGTSGFHIGNYLADGLPKTSAIYDEFGLWNRALDSTEINQLYLSGRGQTMVSHRLRSGISR